MADPKSPDEPSASQEAELSKPKPEKKKASKETAQKPEVEEAEAEPATERKALDALLSKQLEEFDGSTADPTVSLLKKVSEALNQGHDISKFKKQINKVAKSQMDKLSVIDMLVMAHNMDRMVQYISARSTLERFLLNCLNTAKMTPLEALAYYKVVQAEASQLSNLVSMAAGVDNPSKDVGALVDKVSKETMVSKGKDELDSVSPQARELIRRIRYRATKVAGMKVSKGEKPPDKKGKGQAPPPKPVL